MIRNNKQYGKSLIAALLLFVGLMMIATKTPLAQSGGNPGVVPPNTNAHGTTYGEWGARWWLWALSLPADANHPLFDETGIDCGRGQSGPVWFLGGVFNVSGTATRDLCIVPPGTTLFFPVLNVLFSTATGDGATEAVLRAGATAFTATAIDLACEVDGSAIKNLQGYRAQSPLFTYGPLIDNNIFGLASGLTSPAISDGYFLMLSPLSPGPHTIHFHGTFPTCPFTLDVTYNLTVAKS